MIWTAHQILFEWSNQEDWDGRGMLARMGDDRGEYAVLVEKPEGKRPLGKLRWRWKDNTKMDF